MKVRRVPFYVRTGVVTSFVAILFGLDTGSIGPVTSMPSFKSTVGSFSATIHGVIVSAILIPGAITALVAGALAHRFGHAKVIALGSLIYGIGAAVECGAPSLGGFIFGRLVKGVGNGLFLSNVFVQVSEISPARVRGVMTALPQFITVLGIVIGYFICYGASRLGDSSSSWRIPPGIASGLGLLLSGTYWLTPPSPRWLVSRGRVTEAYDMAKRLGFEQDEQDELLGHSMTSDPAEEANSLTLYDALYLTLVEFREAFSHSFRGRTAFGCFLLGMQQFSGIDGVLYYAPVLFTQAGLSGDQATFLASGVSAITMLAVTIPATLFADHWGRRISSIIGGILITALMLVMGSLYAANVVSTTSGAGRWVVIVSIYLFAITYSCTWAISFRTFLVESLPRKTRSSASSLAQSCNWVANYIVALITPILISKTLFGVYYLFAFCSLLCTVIVSLYMVETKGLSLEAIEQRHTERQSGAMEESTTIVRYGAAVK
ncbi:Glucose transporter GlcP-like protein [Cladobotryum mycophilum]|uniref:Glucose transporter GlcP-like protein n=1 Tax=Cladobotryum mycophilum TaxID=491253 RepID=A0ABR0SHX1_9HYPO